MHIPISHTSGSLDDQSGNPIRLRDIHRVAAGDVNDRRSCALGHETLRGRRIIRSSVATRYQLGLVFQAG
jgi:hypothetical protein